jgi:hypothetical protein
LDVVYAALELYLMGLLPPSDVAPTFYGFNDLVEIHNSNPAEHTAEYEAGGFVPIQFSDVINRHGPRTEAPEGERHFKAAFAMVTATPASDALLDAYADLVDIFGGQTPPHCTSYPLHPSLHPSAQPNPRFSSRSSGLTGDRATLDIELGARPAR